MCEPRSVRTCCHESSHDAATDPHLRPFRTVSEKLSEKWFEQSFERELAGIPTSDGAKNHSLGAPKDLPISALGTFQTVS